MHLVDHARAYIEARYRRPLRERLFARRGGAGEEALPQPPSGPDPVPAPAPGGEVPPTWREEGAVLCVAGRGPLDEAAASLLAQLLGKHGFGARTLAHAEVSRSRLPTLDAARARLVLVVHLDMVGPTAHLRFLVQRLRRRLPGAGVIVGFWPEEGSATGQDDVGADAGVATLREAVEACAARAAGERRPSPPTPVPERAGAPALAGA